MDGGAYEERAMKPATWPRDDKEGERLLVLDPTSGEIVHRNVRDLPTHIGEIMARRLVRLMIPQALIDAEYRAMTPVNIGATVDRSVLGIMVDFAKGVPYFLASGFDDGALARAEDQLGRTPCHAGKPADRVIFPDRKALELMTAKWAG